MKKKMLKIGIASTFLMCLSTLGAVAFFSREDQNRADLVVSTEDEMNEKAGIEKVGVKKAATAKTIDCSRVYAQTAYDGEHYYLRFATAVSGDLDSIVYSADIMGSDVELESKTVTSVYKSITAAGKTFYHNGATLIDEGISTTEDYYWACYTIRFKKDSEFLSKYISVDINVNNGEFTNSKSVSLVELANSKYTLGNYAIDCQTKGKTPSFSYEKVLSAYTHNAATYEITQGGCTDGEYLYYTINAAGNGGTTKNSAGYVIKVDPITKSVVGSTSLIGESVGEHGKGLGNGNLSYNPVDGMIYTFGLNATNGKICDDFRINPKDMSYERMGNLLDVEGFEFEEPSVDKYFTDYVGQTLQFDLDNLEYNPSSERWLVSYVVKTSAGSNITKPRRIFFYDKNLKLIEGVNQAIDVGTFTSDTQYTIQEMSSDENYVYVDFTKYGLSTLHSKIRVFDWDGNEVVTKGVSIEGNSNFSTPSSSNIQNVLFLKGNLYVATYQSGSGLHVTKVSYENLNNGDGLSSSLTFGEKVEYMDKKGTALKLESSQVGTAGAAIKVSKTITAYSAEGKTGKSYSSFLAAKGMITDGNHLYVGLNANTGNKPSEGFDIGILAKFDTNGKLIATSKNSYWWGNGSRLSYYDGSIIVTRNNGDAGVGSLYDNTTKLSGVTLKFNAETLALESDNYDPQLPVPAGGVLDEIAQSPDGTKLAAVYTYGSVRQLYTFNVAADGTMTPIESCQGLVVTTAAYNSSTNASIVSMQGMNDYLYLFYSAAAGGVIRVMDYEGNIILNNKKIDTSAEGTGTKKNYQGLAEVNNTLYYAITSWSGYNGFGLYKISDNIIATTPTTDPIPNPTNPDEGTTDPSNPEATKVTVTFDNNGAGGTTPAQEVSVGEKLTRPEDPTYSYTDERGNTYKYVVEDWYNGSTAWDFEKDVVTSSMTLKAKWTFEDSFFAIKDNLNVRATGTTARIMSFNVLCDDWNYQPKLNTTNRPELVANTLERYQSDVVGLQEFDDAWYTAAEQFEGYKVVNADNPYISGTTYNYSTLAYNTSTVKLVEYSQYKLPTSNQANCRNITTGVFEFIAGENVGERFMVASLHWDTKSDANRVKQATQTSDHLNTWREKYPGIPMMLTGDFNAKDSAESIQTFISASGMYDTKQAETIGVLCNTYHIGNPFLGSAPAQGNIFTGPTSFTIDKIQTDECIDHIFADASVKSLYATTIVDYEALNASDHCPILSDLQF